MGRCLAWDVTVVDTLAPSYVADTAQLAGAAAQAAQERKEKKYENQLPPEYEFVGLAFETLGSIGSGTKEFLADLGQRLEASTGDKRSLQFLQQRLSIAILRGNAASVLGTLMANDLEDLREDYVL